MSILHAVKRILGFYDKQQKQNSENVSEYIRGRKVDFIYRMQKMQRQAEKSHATARVMVKESAKLKRDITEMIATAQGGLKDE